MLLAVSAHATERVVTNTPAGHLIHNSQVFSRDGRHLVFDSRNDETLLASSNRITIVEIATGKETLIYESPRRSPYGPGVGAATFSPAADEVAFIHGLDSASETNPYAPQRRSAGLVALATPGRMQRLDARDVSPPFTPGALRGGTHAHHWSGDGHWLSFTYNDAIIPSPGPAPDDLRTIGIIARHHPVPVTAPQGDGDFAGLGFSVLVVPVTAHPEPGELSRAVEEGWVGSDGYQRADGHRQKRALAFIGHTVDHAGKPLTEVFIADLPDDLARPGGAPLEGTTDQLPAPPAGISIRQLTRSGSTSKPGLQAPRHWVRSSPDGSTIAFLDEDQAGVVQLWGISPNGGIARPLSQLEQSVDTPFTWSPCGRFLATSAAGRLVRINATTGAAEFLTPPSPDGSEPRHGVVFSPDGKQLAYNRRLPHPTGGAFFQVCIFDLPHE